MVIMITRISFDRRLIDFTGVTRKKLSFHVFLYSCVLENINFSTLFREKRPCYLIKFLNNRRRKEDARVDILLDVFRENVLVRFQIARE